MGVLRLLVFFPYISFRLLPSETFPWASLYAIKGCMERISWAKFVRKITADKAFPFLLLLFLSTFFSAFYAVFYQKEQDCLKCLFAYLNPLCIYLFLLKSPIEEIGAFRKLVGIVLLFYISLGLLQFFGLIGFLQPLFSSMLYGDRGGTGMLSGSGRGCCLLTSEPAFAAAETIFVYLTWGYLHSFSRTRKCILDMVMLFFLIFVIRSSSGIVVFAIYLLLEYKLKMIIAVFMAIPLLMSFMSTAEERALQFLYTVFSASAPTDIFFFVLDSSGYRLGSLIAVYRYVFTHPLSLGGGVGLWNISSPEILSDPGFNILYSHSFMHIDAVRPSSYIASVALDMGLLGVILLLNLFRPLLPLLKAHNSRIFPVIGTCMFSIFFSSSIGNPILWVCMAICFRNHGVDQTK
jgi:hypothetical protein